MATNKHATIRYNALDHCFSNQWKRFFIEDLIEACNQAIYEFSGIEDGVKRRQIFDDIAFMESDQGWSIPLERLKEGRRVYYRYSDRTFSIKNQGITLDEAKQLGETLTILTRFKGLPQFEWVEEMQIRLEDTFKLKGNNSIAVGFEQNPYLKGLNFFTDIFYAIQNGIVLEITYQSYKQEKPTEIIIHPWYLKQYNNRWFLFGLNEKLNKISNLALDRIEAVCKSAIKFKDNKEIDFDEYFEDVIGVTVRDDIPTERVKIKISNNLWAYIESKPIHGSQKIINKSADYTIIELELQVNYEFLALLFSFMDKIEIIEPVALRDKIGDISQSILNKYL